MSVNPYQSKKAKMFSKTLLVSGLILGLLAFDYIEATHHQADTGHPLRAFLYPEWTDYDIRLPPKTDRGN